ncbi:SUMF1/EgtB/PvdO family nonheme iron enzyme [Carboxylicivirga mesophila]|uniref:SUMF1/EgtB/PvdO family nonheme iron enzyme n=1 Tax=Carboxylicivirga mesophila TaxID=1166478 RepID=A0ABS5KG41_9BACT|nr:SUMF1/EgtB/PvdO family nonheme iron enzyme [Carboxylicivirga mesophila]MBS2213965.1 SUMF1/EgtB/PvdO family nonheme iron enzyme [Carboxylicivirga mesophila]
MEIKKMNLIVLSLIALLALSASKPKKTRLDENFKEVSHRFYASAYEVTNKEFRDYLNDIKKQNKIKEFEENFPDTTQWTKTFPNAFTEPWTEKYFWHPGFDKYPVVNITKKAATDYCKWLTDKYNSSEKREYKKVVFRLPTEQEWNQMAAVLSGHNLPWYGHFAYEPNQDKYCANVKFRNQWSKESKYEYAADGAMTTSVVGNYKANKLGLFDVIGNVAEITDSGIIKGGSWDNTIDECVVNKAQDFQLPDPRVGFRIVMIIEELVKKLPETQCSLEIKK